MLTTLPEPSWTHGDRDEARERCRESWSDDLGRVQYGRGPVRDSRSQLLHGAMRLLLT